MTRIVRMMVLAWLAAAGAFAASAQATNYSLWINGRHGNGTAGDYGSFAYWGSAGVPAGVNKKAVNWDGYNSIETQAYLVRNALDCFCTGDNWCYVAAHSAGDMMIGYVLANYGASQRQVKDARPNGAGVCADAGRGSQAGWNIKWVRVAAGSGGGTELADFGRWTTGEPLVHEHKVSTARAMYNHNDTHGVMFYMYAAAADGIDSWLLPGQDDGVVAYHSAGAVAGTAGGAYCNPSDWWCRDLTLGSGPTEKGWPKWNNHSVVFRDDGENYQHGTYGAWQGVTAVVRADMDRFAR